MIAMGAALVALVVSVVAAVVVIGRNHDDAASGTTVEERKVKATDVVKLTHDTVELDSEGGVTRGARVKDTALATALGVGPKDVITAISGRAITRDYDLHDIFFNTSLMRATTLYVELERDHEPLLVRWKIDGDLRAARRGAYDWASPTTGGTGSLGTYGGAIGSLNAAPPPPPPPPPDPDPDDLDLDSNITKLDDTHYEIAKALIDKVQANPMGVAKGARVVPAVKNGKPDGFKLYAIRPSSLYAKLGFTNGDTLQRINGLDLLDATAALEAFTKVRDATMLEVEIMRRGKPVLLTFSIK
jgi:S1-C subfamily serine protease